MLDAGCGSGRLTIALAQAGAQVTGIDTSAERLEQARRRSEAAGTELLLLEGDFNGPLTFTDASYDAVTSRLALMAADDPVATLRELRRVLEPGGRLVTVLWASPAENPWFAVPREAVAAALGAERASFARAFGGSATRRRPPPSIALPASTPWRPSVSTSARPRPTPPRTGRAWPARTATSVASRRP